jgi:hypothetical protein
MVKWGQIKRKKQENTSNEDVFFCSLTDKQLLPTRERAMEFSFEQCQPSSWNGSLPSIGAHKPWMYLPLPLVESVLHLVKV